jgi:protein-tyrosine-phosphatase
MNILFVCKHNRFRSKAAEALFKYHYKGESAKARSGGVILDFMHPYMSRNVVWALRARGVGIRDDGSRKVDDLLLKWADRIIIVADNVSSEFLKEFKSRVSAIWAVKDVSENDIHAIERRINEIEEKVKELIAGLPA